MTGVFETASIPAIASDPFILVVDALVVIMLAYVLYDRGRREVVGWMGVSYAITLLGFVGSGIATYQRVFQHTIMPQFSLWALKDLGVCIGLVYLIVHNWRRRV